MSIKENLERVRASLNEAAVRAGREPSDIRLMAVSKTKPVELIREAYEAGQRLFGENRVQEASDKFAQLPEEARVELIGHLQTNKIRTAAETFSCIQTVDSLRMAEKLASRCSAAGRTMDVLLQLKTSDEETKTGFFSPGVLEEAAGRIRELDSLRLRGLMTIAPFTDDEKTVREAFAACRTTRDSLVSLYPDQDFSVLSMGMSSDYEWALLDGATLVRIGSAIFGVRP